MLDYLTILRMHYSQNLSFREISASVGCGKTASVVSLRGLRNRSLHIRYLKIIQTSRLKLPFTKNAAKQKPRLQSLTYPANLKLIS